MSPGSQLNPQNFWHGMFNYNQSPKSLNSGGDTNEYENLNQKTINVLGINVGQNQMKKLDFDDSYLMVGRNQPDNAINTSMIDNRAPTSYVTYDWKFRNPQNHGFNSNTNY